jgi:hypothetical protein
MSEEKKEGQVSQPATSENGTKTKTNSQAMDQERPQVNPEQRVIERSIERHLRVTYGLNLQKTAVAFSEVEKALDQIQMTYVLDEVKYIVGEASDELKKNANRVSSINGRNVLLLSSGVEK